jgi:hypothetical protein
VPGKFSATTWDKIEGFQTPMGLGSKIQSKTNDYALNI